MNDAITSKATQAKVERRVASLQEQRKSDILAVMATVQGRRLMWHVIDDLAGLHGYSLAADNSTFLSEGRRSVGGRLVLELQEASVELFVKMTEEAIRGGLSQKILMNGDDAKKGDDNG